MKCNLGNTLLTDVFVISSALSSRDQEIAEKTSKLSEFEERLGVLTAEVEAKTLSFNETEQERDAAKSRLEELQSKLESSEAARTELEERLVNLSSKPDLEAENQKLAKDLANRNLEIEAKTKLVEELESKLEDKSAECERSAQVQKVVPGAGGQVLIITIFR